MSYLPHWIREGPPSSLCTSELSYWREDTPHALVLVGLDATHAYLLDPAYSDEVPAVVTIGDFLLAWSCFGQMYALITKRSR